MATLASLEAYEAYAAPAGVTDLMLTITSGSENPEIRLTWIVPASTIALREYIIKCSPTVVISTRSWDSSALQVLSNVPQPGVPGTRQSFVWTDVSPGMSYQCALKTQDVAGASSVLSNVAKVSISPMKTIVFIWDPAHTTLPYQLQYQIFWGTASGVYSNFQDVGSMTTTSVSVPWGVFYFFAVKAYIAELGLAGPFSNEVKW
ncbi:MAG: hypothetical protein IPL87_03730 [Candidatus Moraniibacteriota bacterium]|nr:MAG: hypothetical protein IPL87_03730 [Candidatus Moranbacteria bacterium]